MSEDEMEDEEMDATDAQVEDSTDKI